MNMKKILAVITLIPISYIAHAQVDYSKIKVDSKFVYEGDHIQNNPFGEKIQSTEDFANARDTTSKKTKSLTVLSD